MNSWHVEFLLHRNSRDVRCRFRCIVRRRGVSRLTLMLGLIAAAGIAMLCWNPDSSGTAAQRALVDRANCVVRLQASNTYGHAQIGVSGQDEQDLDAAELQSAVRERVAGVERPTVLLLIDGEVQQREVWRVRDALSEVLPADAVLWLALKDDMQRN